MQHRQIIKIKIAFWTLLLQWAHAGSYTRILGQDINMLHLTLLKGGNQPKQTILIHFLCFIIHTWIDCDIP